MLAGVDAFDSEASMALIGMRRTSSESTAEYTWIEVL